MKESKDTLPEHEVDDSHDSIEVMDLSKWITPQPKHPQDDDAEDSS